MSLDTVPSLPKRVPFFTMITVSPSFKSGFPGGSSERGISSARTSFIWASRCSRFAMTLATFSASFNTSLLTTLISSHPRATIFRLGSLLSFSRTSCKILSFSSNSFANFLASSRRAVSCFRSSFSWSSFISVLIRSISLAWFSSSSSLTWARSRCISSSRIRSPICLVSESISSVARSITKRGNSRRSATDKAKDSPIAPGKSL